MTERSHPGAATRRNSSGGRPPAKGPSPRDLEMLAAFIDQRLADDEREAFMKRLDEDQALYEVFVETVRSRDEAAGGGPAEVVEHPASRRAWPWWAAAAAAGLAAVLWIVPLGPGQAPYGEALVADGRLEPVLGEDWYEHRWRTMRGITASPAGDTAFRLGVWGLDLEVALGAGRVAEARVLALRIAQARDQLSQLLAEEHRRLHAELAGRPAAASPDAARRAREANRRMRQELADADALDLGRWTEAGRLAAISGNSALLGSRRYRRELQRLAAGDWTPEVEAHLEGMTALLAARQGELDLEAVARALTALIEEG